MKDINKTLGYADTEIINIEDDKEEFLNNLYRELGKAYYESAAGNPLPQLAHLFEEISELLKEDEVDENICKNCGAEIEEGAAFCTSCGASIKEETSEPQKRFCPNCGKELKEEAKFCGKCGKRV